MALPGPAKSFPGGRGPKRQIPGEPPSWGGGAGSRPWRGRAKKKNGHHCPVMIHANPPALVGSYGLQILLCQLPLWFYIYTTLR